MAAITGLGLWLAFPVLGQCLGGPYANVAPEVRAIIEGIRAETPGLEIAVRLSAADWQPFEKGADGVGVTRRVRLGGDVGPHREARRGNLDAGDLLGEEVAGQGHERAVEGAGDGKELGLDAVGLEGGDSRLHLFTGDRSDPMPTMWHPAGIAGMIGQDVAVGLLVPVLTHAPPGES